MRATILAVAVFHVVRCFGQTPTAAPAFEVASVKVSQEPPGSSSDHSTLGSLSMRNVTLRACIQLAYNVKACQVLGGPKWLDSERYDIDAKAAGPARDPELYAMLQTLLAERFQLVLHREGKAFPGYALTVAKTGLKMHAGTPGSSQMNTRNGSMTAVGASMAHLARGMSRQLGVPVDDATGVPGVFDFKLEWTLDDNRAGGADAADPAALAGSLSNALQDQLGLKLEARKMLLEVLVIDRAEKPAEN